ncbi:MAG: ADP-ribosylglycohydrolase family protein [Hyphomicrobiales bacterium]|nr:ADP-ribosylglycohydrolase family protein [Hyphomicrobiales bacterium]
MSTRISIDRVRGALLGGAVGDALGAAIEFLTLAEIRAEFGDAGLSDYVPAYGRRGAITDDTQMTLFTAEGLLRAWVRHRKRGICGVPSVIHHAYLRWLLTQGEKPMSGRKVGTDGWLYAVPELHSRRAPGNTCLGALAAVEALGLPARNNSKGCGGVMRVAPAGLFAQLLGDNATVFKTASEAAALTHGHPTGFLTAGYHAVVIAALTRGETLPRALDAADNELKQHPDYGECARAIEAARALAARGRPSPEQLETLGGGWIAEEALAIAVCSALAAKDFSDGVLLAVNHSGDSDSTGAIAGNVLGTLYGIAAIPTHWLEELELRAEIDCLASDLYDVVSDRVTSSEAWDRYPGW